MVRKNKSKGQKAATKKTKFDEAALSQLTKKIESNLSKPREQKDQHSGKRKRNDMDNKDARPKKKHARESGEESGKPFGKPKKAPGDSRATLLEEIKALGGDEADLDLVAGLDSDAEEGQQPKLGKDATEVDKALKDELARFAAGLSFEKVRDEDAATDEEPEEDEETGEDGSDWEDEDKDESAPGLVAAPPEERSQGRAAAGKLVFEPRPDWHALSQERLPAPLQDDIRNFSVILSSLKAHARTLWEADAAAYNATVSSSSTHKFMTTIMASGTMSDKVSALTLAVQESPVHNVKPLESLLNLAGKKSRGQAIAALGALADLFGNGVVLPSDRRLRTFQTQPGLLGTLQGSSANSWKPGQALPGRLSRAHLIMWIYEDWLKEQYFKMIQLLEMWCGDEIEYSRSRALDYVFGLLRDKPEQEANLLRILVNKLGDRERKIASRASYLLLQLLNVHPGMKAIAIKTMEEEVFLRPGQSLRAKYYAINTLNQTILSSREPQIAGSLIRIYFELFVSLLRTGALGSINSFDEKDKPKAKHEKGKKPAKSHKDSANTKPESVPDPETAEKLVSAILTGVNRAVPFASTDDDTLEKHLDTLFRIAHSSNFNTSIQALMLIQQLSTSKQLAGDRFYRTLYESLLDPRLTTSSKQALYLNLLYRSLKNDVDVRRVKAFVKRMLQICYLHQPSFACGILFLVTQLENTFSDLKTLLNEPEEDADDQEVYRDAPVEDSGEGAGTAQDSRSSRASYDGRKRDPQYSNADQSCLWEIIPYFRHFHPSVSVFAANFLDRQKSLPKPELANHTLMHFLDKFVYRNPKAADSKRGGSIMQPVLAAGSSANIVVPGRESAKHQPSVNSAAFWNLKQEDVAAEDVFFHEYFSQIGRPGQATKAKKKKDVGEGEENEIDEEEIWDALVNSRPGIGGEDDEDVDMDMGTDDESDLGSLLDDMSDGSLGSDAGDDDDDAVDEASGVEEDEPDDWVDGADLSAASDEEEERPAGKKARGKGGKGGKGRLTRKDLKSLPTFATADDYAALLAAEEDEDYM